MQHFILVPTSELLSSITLNSDIDIYIRHEISRTRAKTMMMEVTMKLSKITKLRHSVSVVLLNLVFVIALVAATTPASARFLQPDAYDPWAEGVGTNRYAYAQDDPINNSDPNGHCSQLLGDTCGVDTPTSYGLLQSLMPITTAQVSAHPIGGSVESQIRYGSEIGRIRTVAAAGTAVSAIAPYAGAEVVTAFGIGTIIKTSSDVVRVGRWMSRAEYDAMKNSGKVQEGTGGITNVSRPATPTSFRNPKKEDIYVEFDVPKSSIKLKDPNQGWYKIEGPNSPAGRLGRPGTATMPNAGNITKGNTGTTIGSGKGGTSSLATWIKSWFK